MRIGILSDTHSPEMGVVPPAQVARAFEGVDLILHAGDIKTPQCLDWLEQIAPVIAVEISPALVDGDPRVKHRQFIEVEGRVIAMTHDFLIMGWGGDVFPGNIGRGWPPDKSIPAAVETTFGRPVDTVVFGHTHFAMIEEHQGVLFINPGSPTLPNHVRRLGSVGILEITADRREAWLVQLGQLDG